MSAEFWAAFAASSLTLLLLPGPTNLALVSYGLSLGRSAVWPAVLGATLGRLTALGLSALAAQLLLAAPGGLLLGLNAAAIAYMGWLGLRLLGAGEAHPVALPGGAGPPVLRRLWLVTLLNPLNLAFFGGLVPQAMEAAERPWLDAALLAATFLVLSLAVSLGYGLLAAQARLLCTSPGLLRGCNRAGGALLLSGAGVLALRLPL